MQFHGILFVSLSVCELLAVCISMDCHKYVKVAYHGFRELSKEDKD